MSEDVEGFFFGSGHKGFPWGDVNIGQVFGGVIVEDPYMTQQGEFKERGDTSPRRPLWWDNKKPTADNDGRGRQPVMQMVVPVQTDLRDPGVVGDTGVRAHYIAGKAMIEAVKVALSAAGVKAPAKGGELYLRWASGRKGREDPRVWQAKYTAPAANLNGWDTQASTPAPQPVDPVAKLRAELLSAAQMRDLPPPAQPPARDGWGSAPVAAPVPVAQPQALPPAAWAMLTPEQQAQMAHLAPVSAAPAGTPAQGSVSAPTGW